MKLITKTSLLYFVLTIPIVCIGGYFCYNMIITSVNENTDEELWREKLNAESIIQKNDTLSKFNFGTSYVYQIKRIVQHQFPSNYEFSNTSQYDSTEEEVLPFRTLKSQYRSKHGLYLISISKASIETDD